MAVKTWHVLTGVAVFLGIAGGGPVLLGKASSFLAQTSEKAEEVEQVEEASQKEEQPKDTWSEAVYYATSASEKTQSAKTLEEWATVANHWEKAIELMNLVPETSENYATAQQKAEEYQPNFEYAKTNAGDAYAATQPKPEATQATEPTPEVDEVEVAVAAVNTWLALQDPDKKMFKGAGTLDNDYELAIIVDPAWKLADDNTKRTFIEQIGRQWQEMRSPDDPNRAILWIAEHGNEANVLGVYDNRGVTLRD